MQTFLPLPSFQDSMRVLDDKRLGNQVYREGVTLLRGGWPNHPASKMWRGYKDALALYLWEGCEELARRGKDYTDRPWHQDILDEMNPDINSLVLPPWLGDDKLHSSHRANLLRKDPIWYGQYGWDEEPSEGYYWPVTVDAVEIACEEERQKLYNLGIVRLMAYRDV